MTRKTKKRTTPGGRSGFPSVEQPPEPDDTTERVMQQSAAHGFREDDALKRIIKQHPQKGIPQVEDMNPADAPPKE